MKYPKIFVAALFLFSAIYSCKTPKHAQYPVSYKSELAKSFAGLSLDQIEDLGSKYDPYETDHFARKASELLKYYRANPYEQCLEKCLAEFKRECGKEPLDEGKYLCLRKLILKQEECCEKCEGLPNPNPGAFHGPCGLFSW